MITAQNLNRLMKQVVLPARQVLMETELEGIGIDHDYIEKLRIEYSAKRATLEQSIFENVGEPFNINSPKQLQDVLFKKLGFAPAGKTKSGGWSTDNKALTSISEQNPSSAVLQMLLEYKDCQKILSTFIEGTLEHVDPVDGRIHTNYKLHGTQTGRLSSSEPNLQQIPKESTIKGIFVARKGYQFVEADFGQAEFRWWAEYSRDTQMVADIISGVDIHRSTYAMSHGVDISTVSDEQRQQAKATVFGLMYGRGTFSLAEGLKIPEMEAKKIVSTFFGKYPQAQNWLKQQIFIAKKTGQVISYFGRIRRLPGINGSDKMLRADAERQAKNSPIQGAASDTTMISANRIRTKFKTLGINGKLVMTVHDSLVYEVPTSRVAECFDIIKQEAERSIAGTVVPMSADIKVGTRLGSLKKIKSSAELASDLCIIK